MAKKKIVILCISILLIIGILVGAYFCFFTNAFKPLLSEALGYEGMNITKISLNGGDHYHKSVETTDPDEINMVLDIFKDKKVVDEESFDFSGLIGCPLTVTLFSGDEKIVCIEFHKDIINLRDKNKKLFLDSSVPDDTDDTLLEHFFSSERNKIPIRK